MQTSNGARHPKKNSCQLSHGAGHSSHVSWNIEQITYLQSPILILKLLNNTCVSTVTKQLDGYWLFLQILHNVLLKVTHLLLKDAMLEMEKDNYQGLLHPNYHMTSKIVPWTQCSGSQDLVEQITRSKFTLRRFRIQIQVHAVPLKDVHIMSENKSGFSFGFLILVSGFGCLLQVSVTRLIWNAS